MEQYMIIIKFIMIFHDSNSKQHTWNIFKTIPELFDVGVWNNTVFAIQDISLLVSKI